MLTNPPYLTNLKKEKKKLGGNVANLFWERNLVIFRPQKKSGIRGRIFPCFRSNSARRCAKVRTQEKTADKLLVILGERVPKVPKTPGVSQGPPSLRRPPVCNKAATAPACLPRIQSSFCVLSQSERSPAWREREARIDNFALGLHFMPWWRESKLCWHDINCAERSSLCCCFLLFFFRSSASS
jgi:hypothetical protein